MELLFEMQKKEGECVDENRFDGASFTAAHTLNGGGKTRIDDGNTKEDLILKAGFQVWSRALFYFVDFSQSRISVKKCFFNKRTIKVYVNCC